MNEFIEISPYEIDDNVFKCIGKDWMLITAGDENNFNTMTASWGGLGVLWRKNVSFSFVRKHRHTYGFVENSGTFTLSFFDEEYRDALNICGTKSGRDCDKVKVSGLTPEFIDGTPTFKEARLVLVCKKLYIHDIDPNNFIDMNVNELYPAKDYHRMYIGEILKVLKK